MIFHVCSLDKFIPPFIKLINEEFGEGNHQFWIAGSQNLNKYPIEKADNVYVTKSSHVSQMRSYFRLLVMLHSAKKVILHGLSNPHVIFLLALCPWLLGKCYWVLWGGDLYVKRNARKTIKWRLREIFRCFVIPRFKCVITTVPGDYELVKKWYSTQAEFIHSLMYESHVARKPNSDSPRDKGVLNLQVGNSADPENHHLEVFEWLQQADNHQEFIVHCPLSYGDPAYAKHVTEKGREIFGNRFQPLLDFMSFEKYNSYLSKIDVAVFNHRRQQAMGNIIGLLSMGKTVYIRSSETPFEYFKSLNLKVKDTKEIRNGVDVLDETDKAFNVEVVQETFTKKKLVDSWVRVFHD